MNNIITTLFRCLCQDLGVQLRAPLTEDTLPELGNLKNGLLCLAETEESFEADPGGCRLDRMVWFHKFLVIFAISLGEDGVAVNPLLTSESLSRGFLENKDIDPDVFECFYQVLSFLLKIETTVTKTQEESYVTAFKSTEEGTRAWHCDRSNPVTRVARQILRRASAAPGSILDLSADSIQRFGRHGPGATYYKESGSDKNWFNVAFDQLSSVFPFDKFFPNVRMWTERACSERISTERFITARLTLVPKTYKGPRGVFISPKEAIFAQIGIDGCIKDWVKRSWLRYSYAPEDQVPSQVEALLGSINRETSTLDLSDASDRVPLELIRYLFHRRDYLALACTRPSFVDLPNGERHRLAMLSPMGDGKTFAVLSVISVVLAVSAMLNADGALPTDTLTTEVCEEYAKKVTVFGDDIIVPTRYFKAVCNALEMHNLKVNVLKSFSKGFFRESCGCDAFKGKVVTPLRLKIGSCRDESFPKWVGIHNYARMCYPHLERTIARLRVLIETHWPDVGYTSDAARHPVCILTTKSEVERRILRSNIRFNPDLQLVEQYCVSGLAVAKLPDSLDPWWDLSYALMPKGSKELTSDSVEKMTRKGLLQIPVLSTRRKTVGSPNAAAYYERLLADVPLRNSVSRPAMLLRAWRELF